jgi:hypothetical protein
LSTGSTLDIHHPAQSRHPEPCFCPCLTQSPYRVMRLTYHCDVPPKIYSLFSQSNYRALQIYLARATAACIPPDSRSPVGYHHEPLRGGGSSESSLTFLSEVKKREKTFHTIKFVNVHAKGGKTKRNCSSMSSPI